MASARPPASSKKAKSDQSVMGTNNSSIVSKRSVERLYYPEPHFFRYFVKKPQRRAPLINRGYWLRMHAIDAVVQQFLEESSSQKKLILNLGCGYDPLAFQWLSKVKGKHQHATFIDVDFPDLISKKSEVISATPQICELLGEIHLSKDFDGIFLRSASYYAVGCDLAYTDILDKLLSSVIDVSQYQVLCIAEVSITYMDAHAADSLISWAARQNDARFCLLEQYLPDGVDHPFAQKMLQHFINLQTPLKNVGTYPGLDDQVKRFSRAGWLSVHARSLWDIFQDPCFVSSEERFVLDEVEAFDEWEELILFASHYFLLVAKQQSNSSLPQSSSKENPVLLTGARAYGEWIAHSSILASPCAGKRFGSIMRENFHDRNIHHIGGFGPQSRTTMTYLYRYEDQQQNVSMEKSEAIERSNQSFNAWPSGCEPRMCFTNTALGFPKFDWLLVGGRKSPQEPLKDCWLLHDLSWHRVDDLPFPLYRHCSTSINVGSDPAVVVYGGKTSNNVVSDNWLLWRESVGWEILTLNLPLKPRFGAAMVSCEPSRGFLIGGMSKDGLISSDVYSWNIICPADDCGSQVHLAECVVSTDESDTQALEYLFRFGATIEWTSSGLLLIGGVANNIIPSYYEIIGILLDNNDISTSGPPTISIKSLITDWPSPRSLLVGHSSLYYPGRVIILGGGAVCFSFGAYWNTSPLFFCSQVSPLDHKRIVFVRSFDEKNAPNTKVEDLNVKTNIWVEKEIKEEPSLLSVRTFKNLLTDGQPVVSRNLELGRCIIEWQSLQTVKDRAARDQEVVVHISGHRHMDFRQKNFDYVKKSFGQFIDDFQFGHRQYLRSLALQNPVEKPADFMTDFPRLAQDFTFFDQLRILNGEIHSSVLRISGFVDMWLHYDVMANFLCQIRGIKRLMLFPPSDVSHFSLPAGSSTSSVDCFNANFAHDPALAQTHPHHVILQPGDVLYIPPLWLHAASPIDTLSSDSAPLDGVSISINIFIRNLESGYAPGKDIYGNRDVQAYEKGRQDLEKITRAFDRLPPDMRRFYLDRLADELKEKASLSKQG